MRKRRCSKETILLAISLLGLIALFVVGVFWLPERLFERQISAVGSLYRENPEAARMYLYALFEGESAENLKAGELALRQYGFLLGEQEGESLHYLKRAMGFSGLLVPVFGLCLVFLCLLFWGLWKKKRHQRAETEQLLRRLSALQKEKSKEEYLQVLNKRTQTFIENVAHQIKTPISRVSSSLYLVQEDLESRTGQKYLEECQEHLEGIRVLMKRLTDIGAMEAGKVLFRKEQIILQELLQDAAKACHDGSRIRVMVAPEGEGSWYHGDYEWLREAFLNLFNNAVEHDKTGGPVEVTCSKSKDYYRILVRDYGEGLSAADIPNLFDRFYQPEHAKSGHTGIGLNLTRLIIEGHFGSIQAENHEEGGAVFLILLPLYPLKEGKLTA